MTTLVRKILLQRIVEYKGRLKNRVKRMPGQKSQNSILPMRQSRLASQSKRTSHLPKPHPGTQLQTAESILLRSVLTPFQF